RAVWGGLTRTMGGLNPPTPNAAAGRSTVPPGCAPKAAGTMKSAAGAADPLEEAPGVCAGLCGLVVGPGNMPANSAVTVLPRMTAPAARATATQAASQAARLSL